jgi:hypothetical protein
VGVGWGGGGVGACMEAPRAGVPKLVHGPMESTRCATARSGWHANAPSRRAVRGAPAPRTRRHAACSQQVLEFSRHLAAASRGWETGAVGGRAMTPTLYATSSAALASHATPHALAVQRREELAVARVVHEAQLAIVYCEAVLPELDDDGALGALAACARHVREREVGDRSGAQPRWAHAARPRLRPARVRSAHAPTPVCLKTRLTTSSASSSSSSSSSSWPWLGPITFWPLPLHTHEQRGRARRSQLGAGGRTRA